jgi:phosphohistidine phosphatase
MDLYLIRHADALPQGPDARSDDGRPLSDKGREQCAALAKCLQARGIALDHLYTSPLLRARQTAEALQEQSTGTRPELVVSEALALDAKSKKVKHFFLTVEGESVGLIGHQPDLARWVAWLIGSKKADVTLAKSGFAKIVCADGPGKGHGVLTLLVSPAWYAC